MTLKLKEDTLRALTDEGTKVRSLRDSHPILCNLTGNNMQLLKRPHDTVGAARVASCTALMCLAPFLALLMMR